MFSHVCSIQAFEESLKDIKEECYSPRFYHNFGEEDFNGVLKIACRLHAGDGMERRVLRGCLLRLVAANAAD